MEDNKLIAEFMGMQLGHPDKNETRWKTNWFEKLIVNGNKFESGARHSHLLFNTSWDWLMPVVEKIEGMNLEVDKVITSADVHIVYGNCKIVDEDSNGLFEFYSHGTNSKDKREATYKAVVEFIKWHNQQTNKT